MFIIVLDEVPTRRFLMTVNSVVYIVAYLGILMILAPPVGVYMAKIYTGRRSFFSALVLPIEGGFYRLCRINRNEEMSWKQYSIAFLLFNAVGLVVLFLMQMMHLQPLQPPPFVIQAAIRCAGIYSLLFGCRQ